MREQTVAEREPSVPLEAMTRYTEKESKGRATMIHRYPTKPSAQPAKKPERLFLFFSRLQPKKERMCQSR